MEIEEEFQDDSFIIRAFDDAVSKYKIMHGQTNYSSSAKEEVNSGTEQNQTHVSDESHESMRDGQEKSGIEPYNGINEVDETTNKSPVIENGSLAPCDPSSCVNLSDALHLAEKQKESVDHSNLNLKDVEDYNQLLNQYYELEEKRQKVLEKLYQYGDWNCQGVSEGSGCGVQWGVSSTHQEHPISASQTSQNHDITSCCPSGYPSSTVATVPENSSFADGDIIKIAMGAAERAISSSMKTKAFSDYDVNKEKGERRDEIMPQSAGYGTDLSVVLNAWYSAGFYTGKYLVEQSYAKK